MSFSIFNPLSTLKGNLNILNKQISDLNEVMSIIPTSMSNKGINIDDTTIALSPSSSNPMQSSDTFPFAWLKTTSPIGTIRTYHYDSNGSTWIDWAVRANIKVIIGIDLASYTSQLNSLASTYAAASSSLKSQYDANVIAIAIGNEEPASNLSLLQSGIAYARTLVLPANAKYTSVLNFDNDWSQNSFPPSSCTFTSPFLTLNASLDVICFNCYGGYFTYGTQQFITVQNSVSWQSTVNGGSVLLNQFGAIRFAMAAASITTELWITETGWCSSTELSGNPAWSNTTNEKAFYTGFLTFSLTTPFVPQSSTSVAPPDKIIYFSVRDVPGGEGGAGFGLYTSSSTLTAKF